ncbi:MAG: tRNA (pseudouridine(54)-N(1))-methyltransferase TrmY [Candidatus Thalassarchaeaceae archaeon]|nr:tRNA (pseudouridine(54)-N(1))-methyltransferase TrmY [Candidatus Thalassarchaeaceae archaeon]
MERRFAIIEHRAPSSGKINLNDLPGSSGRIDVLARAINTALFLSHGIREDTDVTLHLMGGTGPARRIWLQGSRLRGVHPDERAIAGQIAKALKNPIPAIGQWVELHPGFWHSGGAIEQTIREWEKEACRIFVLDAEGVPFSKDPLNHESVGFILSDDQPFSDIELKSMESIEKVSLGSTWLQGNACISILHHLIDN